MKFYEKEPLKALARDIVLNRLSKTLDGNGIGATSEKYVHIIATNVEDSMLAIVRQCILLCHFPNFYDNRDSCRTKVTILVPGANPNVLHAVEQRLNSKENFGLLLHHCLHTIRMEGEDNISSHIVEKSFIDVFVEVIGISNSEDYLKNYSPEPNALVNVFAKTGDLTPKTIKELEERCHQVYQYSDIPPASIPQVSEIDTNQAKLVHMVYDASQYKSEIYPQDIDKAEKYILPLNTFIYHTKKGKTDKKWQELIDKNEPEKLLSNLFCVDAFGYKLRSIKCDLNSSKEDMKKQVKEHLLDLGRTEHARWNVEKLILGYRPLNEIEQYEDELIYGEKLDETRSELKKARVHIDLCSYSRLRDIDTNAVKYDYFLMLAMPEIIYRYKRKNQE